MVTAHELVAYPYMLFAPERFEWGIKPYIKEKGWWCCSVVLLQRAIFPVCIQKATNDQRQCSPPNETLHTH